MFPRRKIFVRTAVTAAAVMVLPFAATSPSQAQDSLVGVVSSTPVAYTPHMKTGYIVHEDAVVRGKVYVGGEFSQFEDAERTTTYDRQNFVAYLAATGKVLPIAPNFDDYVLAMVASPDGRWLYIGGVFKTVDGQDTGSLVRLNLKTGTIDPRFKGPGGRIYALQFANRRLYVGGSFAKHLVALNPVTGRNSRTVDIQVRGVLEGSGGLTRVSKIAINPAGDDLIAIGDFTTVDGQSRVTSFRLTLGATAATLSSWHPQRFDVACIVKVPYFLRDVAWAPDGSYFTIVSSGGPSGGYPATGFCDAAGRWEASSEGSTAEPTWINWTGGDSIYSVAISDTAVYVGGHMRWLDNPDGHDSEGSNAFQVDSIGVIDPATGLADRSWNADYMTRGHGKDDLTLFRGGLVIGGDGTIIKNKYHRGTAIFPLT